MKHNKEDEVNVNVIIQNHVDHYFKMVPDVQGNNIIDHEIHD